MPKLTVKTEPVRAPIKIFRVTGRYGVLANGISPVKASREEPWTWRATFTPVMDVRGQLWIPQSEQIQGLIKSDATVTMKYLRA